jgi:DNA integrity scanning protein DisA with diadenylate cyclase activity
MVLGKEDKVEEQPGQAQDKNPARKKTEKPAVKKAAKPVDPAVAEARAEEAQNRAVLESAGKIADRIAARQIFMIIEDTSNFKIPSSLAERKNFVLVVSEPSIDDDLRKQYKNILTLPDLHLTRMGKVKMAVMRSLSAHMIAYGDKIVCVTGSRGLPTVDSIVVLDIGKEFELLGSAEIANISTQVRTEVFEELVTISTELANQGREGKPIGAIFVLGDTDKVMQLSRQLIFNPFHGYPEEERNILDPRLKDTIKEFSTLDGAFVIRDDGVIMAAGRHLNAVLEGQSLPQGLGARHAAAAGMTDVTASTAIVVSESTGTVRIFRNGKIFMEIEKAAPFKR